jgi:hypothetical protein
MADLTTEEIWGAYESIGSAGSGPTVSAPFHIVNPADLAFVRVPAREWIVRDWLPIGTVTGNYGDGGTGKTLVSQQLQTACATEIAWAGLQVTPCKSFALYCEDTEEELHRRQHDINDVFGLEYAQLAPMRWISGVGDDWTLASFTADGRLHPTERWTMLVREVTGFDARLLILDTAADLFAGDENNRGQVRRFISLLGRQPATLPREGRRSAYNLRRSQTPRRRIGPKSPDPAQCGRAA